MNREVAVSIRDETCTSCKMCVGARVICETGAGPSTADIMVVSKMPNSDKYQKVLVEELEDVGIDTSKVFFTSAIKCRSWSANPSRGDIKVCKRFLDEEIAMVQPKWVLALGNEALSATTGHSGIMKYRGRIIEHGRTSVIPTVSPAAVLRNPGQRAAWVGDLRFFAMQTKGQSSTIRPPKVAVIDSVEKLKKLKRALQRAELLSYDIETNAASEFEIDAAIVSIAGTMVIDNKLMVWALPLSHPQSPFRVSWRKVLRALAPYLPLPKKQIAHNGKFDARWLRQFGVEMKVTFDTMLSAHILDENRQKGLKPQATSRLGVAPWAVDTRNLVDMPIKEVLLYNALDTYYTYHIYLQMRQELIDNPRLLRVFRHVTTPANQLLIDTERRGIWVNTEKLATAIGIARATVEALEEQIMEFVPDPESPDSSIYAESTSPWPETAKGKPSELNFNPSNWARWWLFEHLGLPILARGKEKDDGRPGDPSMAEGVMLQLRDHNPVIGLLLRRSEWIKISQFLTAYSANLDPHDRLHTTFKLAGTVTGRLSSGKADADKLTGRIDNKGINIQQTPRDPFVRGLFGAPPGWLFVEADFSQVELRVVAFIADEKVMKHLYQTGQDIHRATAAWVLGVPPDQIDKDQRKKAKAVNFGFVYGMGAPKFVNTAFEKYQSIFTLDEAKAVRRNFFQQFPGLPAWHARQRRLVHKYARVESPLGRVRHLPDVRSADGNVVAEAERQAINSPVQSFASDLTMLSMIEVEKKFKKLGIQGHSVGTVHDSILFELHEDSVREALPLIKDTMENLPIQRLFGVYMDVPIVADIQIGKHWGGARELEVEEIYDWKG